MRGHSEYLDPPDPPCDPLIGDNEDLHNEFIQKAAVQIAASLFSASASLCWPLNTGFDRSSIIEEATKAAQELASKLAMWDPVEEERIRIWKALEKEGHQTGSAIYYTIFCGRSFEDGSDD